LSFILEWCGTLAGALVVWRISHCTVMCKWQLRICMTMMLSAYNKAERRGLQLAARNCAREVSYEFVARTLDDEAGTRSRFADDAADPARTSVLPCLQGQD